MNGRPPRFVVITQIGADSALVLSARLLRSGVSVGGGV